MIVIMLYPKAIHKCHFWSHIFGQYSQLNALQKIMAS